MLPGLIAGGRNDLVIPPEFSFRRGGIGGCGRARTLARSSPGKAEDPARTARDRRRSSNRRARALEVGEPDRRQRRALRRGLRRGGGAPAGARSEERRVGKE